jgi:hypothetical protein
LQTARGVVAVSANDRSHQVWFSRGLGFDLGFDPDVRFDLVGARLAAIIGEIAGANKDVEVVEFAARAMLGPLVMRAWKENEMLRPQPQREDIGQLRITHFSG